MPYPNFHSCRLLSPVAGADTNRVKDERSHDGKSYDVTYQQQPDGSWKQQSFGYARTRWDAGAARSHCSSHGGTFEAVRVSKEEFHCECIECGYKVTSEEHCAKMRCPKCSGQMRREERPGPGEDLTKEEIQFFKKDAKKQIVYGIVWEPDFEDAQEHWASKDHIEEAAHDYLVHHREIKLSHGMNITKDVALVESYLAPIDFICNEQTIKEGTWIVGLKVFDKDYWDAIESGEIKGLSAGGTLTFV